MVPVRSARADQIERALYDLHSQVQGQIQLLIIILPDYSGTYGVYAFSFDSEEVIYVQIVIVVSLSFQAISKEYVRQI